MEIKEVDLKENEIWDVFESAEAQDKKLKLEKNEHYLIGVKSLGVKKMFFDNPDGTSREVPTLVLYLDYLNDEKVDKELWVTSKKLIKVIKMFHKSGDLFKKIFEIVKMGEGFQTEYVFVPVKVKPQA